MSKQLCSLKKKGGGGGGITEFIIPTIYLQGGSFESHSEGLGQNTLTFNVENFTKMSIGSIGGSNDTNCYYTASCTLGNLSSGATYDISSFNEITFSLSARCTNGSGSAWRYARLTISNVRFYND